MGILADLVDHVVGIDPDRDWITAAVVDAKTTAVVATDRFTADRDGYGDLLDWVAATTTAGERVWLEGSASYGAGVTGALSHAGEWVVEFDRATTRATKDGAKTDALDAIRAAREALGRDRLAQPRAGGGMREAVRVHHVARAAAVRARTAAINELKAFIVTAPESVRSQLRGLRTAHQVARCAAWRDTPSRPIDERATRMAMRAVAQRIQFLGAEIGGHDAALTTMLDQTVPQLLAEIGVGYVTAAEFYIAWSHPGRCRTDGAYARLGGAAPLDASSGQTVRHRLNRGGDRQLNRALYFVAVTRARCCPRTKAYIERRLKEGLTEREIQGV
jgi:transposase